MIKKKTFFLGSFILLLLVFPILSSRNFENGGISITTITGNLTDFLNLTDTPNSYAGAGSNCVIVNAGETALEFGSCATGSGESWSSIVNGTLATWIQAMNGTLMKQTTFNSNYSTNDPIYRSFANNYTNFSTIYAYSLNSTGITWLQINNGTIATWGQVMNGTVFKRGDWDSNYSANDPIWRSFANNYTNFSTMYSYTLNSTGISWATANNGSLATWLQVMNGTIKQDTFGDNYSDYLTTKNYALNETKWGGNYSDFLAKVVWSNIVNGTMATWEQVMNGTVGNGGNPFDQSLNTTDNVTFFNITLRGNLSLTQGKASITNPLASNALTIDQNGNAGASTSTGGALLVENTGNAGAGIVVYSNIGSTADGRLLVLRADNQDFDQQVLFVQQDGIGGGFFTDCNNETNNLAECASIDSAKRDMSALGVTGYETGKGTLKVTHEYSGTSDASASALSLSVNGTGTSAQGIFLDAPYGTIGKLLNIRNGSNEKFIVYPNGTSYIEGDYCLESGVCLSTSTGTDSFVGNYSDFLKKLFWSDVVNGTLMEQSIWDSNYSANNDIWTNRTNYSYYLASNPSNYITNSTMNKSVACSNIIGGSDADFCVDATGSGIAWSDVDNGTFRYENWDNFTGIPTATPSNGDTTHLSTADQIYDWVIGLAYTTWSQITNGTVALWTQAMNGTLMSQSTFNSNYSTNNDIWTNRTNYSYLEKNGGTMTGNLSIASVYITNGTGGASIYHNGTGWVLRG